MFCRDNPSKATPKNQNLGHKFSLQLEIGRPPAPPVPWRFARDVPVTGFARMVSFWHAIGSLVMFGCEVFRNEDELLRSTTRVRFMLLVSIFSARWIVQRFAFAPRLVARHGTGLPALIILLMAQFTLVLWLRQNSISEYFETRDPVSGASYYFMPLLFALVPGWVARKVRKPSFQ